MTSTPWDRAYKTSTTTISKPQAPPGRKVEGPHNIYQGFVLPQPSPCGECPVTCGIILYLLYLMRV